MKTLTIERQKELLDKYTNFVKKIENASSFEQLKFAFNDVPEFLHSLYEEGYKDGYKDGYSNGEKNGMKKKIENIIKLN